MTAARFIAIEGIDGAGKTTFSANLTVELRRRNWLPVQLTEPTFGELGMQARTLIGAGLVSSPMAHDLLTKDRVEHVSTRVGPLLAFAEQYPACRMILVQDRSYFSSPAYQAMQPSEFDDYVAVQESIAPRPDRVYLLDLAPELSLERILKRTASDRGLDDLGRLAQARQTYLYLAMKHKSFRVLDASKSPNELVDEAIRDIGE